MRRGLKTTLKSLYIDIYKDEKAADMLVKKVEDVVSEYHIEPKDQWFSEKDSILITYGDTIQREGEKGLQTLETFLIKYVGDAISTVHLLPMFPYTSDDGFSVVSYDEINPELGSWENISELHKYYKLMFDAVINHVSKSSEWFQKFLACEKPYDDYFISCDPKADYSRVNRPRALPLLTKFETKEGTKWVWTTFSDDQIDLNYHNPAVYISVLRILLSFAQHGANLIRLDAIGFIWKEAGTSCMHQPAVHKIVQSFRAILDKYAPGTMIITETNVPHKENISYFGGDKKEAQLVYQFPLPPLVMFSLLTGDCTKLARWASSLEETKQGTTYFNFLSSHDGIGLRPIEGILSKEEIQVLTDQTLRAGGRISYKDNGDGTKSPYELNISYQDALAVADDSDTTRINRFIAAETILMSLQGVPGIYIHSLLGSRNDFYDMTVTGQPRKINREKLDYEKLEKEICGDTNRSVIFHEMIRRLNIRKNHPAFSPVAKQKILEENSHVFSIERISAKEHLNIYVNVSSEEQHIYVCSEKHDLLTGSRWDGILEPYQCVWAVEE